MGPNLSYKPGEPLVDAKLLRELHPESLAFMRSIRDYPWWNEFPDFVSTFKGFHPYIQCMLVRDFRIGYEELIARGEREVAVYLDEREKMMSESTPREG